VVPYPRNEGFVGREAFLQKHHKSLLEHRVSSPSSVLCQVMHGLGGVGKTQLAVKYTYDFAEGYDTVAWIRAETPSTLALGFADVAKRIRLAQGREAPGIDEMSRALHDWLESPESGRWLLIFDSAENADDLRNYLPTRGSGHVLGWKLVSVEIGVSSVFPGKTELTPIVFSTRGRVILAIVLRSNVQIVHYHTAGWPTLEPKCRAHVDHRGSRNLVGSLLPPRR
jgi:hypothetical protein